MFFRLIEDLRFVIGAFFLIVSLILVVVVCSEAPGADPDRLNIMASGVMGAFGVFMVGSAVRAFLAERDTKSVPID